MGLASRREGWAGTSCSLPARHVAAELFSSDLNGENKALQRGDGETRSSGTSLQTDRYRDVVAVHVLYNHRSNTSHASVLHPRASSPTRTA